MHHLSTELLLSLTGTQMTHVPYKATPPAMNDLLAGHIQVLFGDRPSVLPQIREGKLRALAVSTAKRSPATPDIPTVRRPVPALNPRPGRCSSRRRARRPRWSRCSTARCARSSAIRR